MQQSGDDGAQVESSDQKEETDKVSGSAEDELDNSGDGDIVDGDESQVETPQSDESPTVTKDDGDEARSQALTTLAAGQRGCSYADANTGAYARTLCWLDLTGFSTEYRQRSFLSPYYDSVLGSAYGSVFTSSSLFSYGGKYYGPVKDYPISIPLSDSYSFTAKLTVSSPGGGARGIAVGAAQFPTWSGAFLATNGFYTGVTGMPALYQLIDGGNTANQRTTEATLSDIRVVSGNGTGVTGYSIVVADAESTDSNESVTWSHEGGSGFTWLPNDPAAWSTATNAIARKSAAVGNACSGTNTSDFPNGNGAAASRSCTGGASQPSPKTGTAMLQISPADATTPFSVTQKMIGNGLQGVAFGVVLGGAQVTVNVSDRILDSTGTPTNANFGASVKVGGGTLITTETGASTTVNSASTDPEYVPISSSAAQVAFATTASGTAYDSYTPSWVCYKSTSDSPVQTRWPTGTGTSLVPPTGTDAQVKGGEFLDCTVTYTPPYLTLIKKVDNGKTTATHGPADFELTAQGQTGTKSLVTGKGNGSAVTARPVAVGTYDLAEAFTPTDSDAAWPYGYTWSGLSCTGGTSDGTITWDTADSQTIAKASVEVGKLDAATCTYTNVANEPHLEISKTSDPATGETVRQNQTVTYTLTFDNEDGTAAIPVDHVDHLGDVLDDATFVAGSIRYGDGSAAPSQVSPITPTGSPQRDPPTTS